MSENEKEEKSFKFIDRRGEGREEKQADAEGEGFTMKESEAQTAHPDQMDFSTLVMSFATGALINLGLTADPHTQKTETNLPLAKQNIDILSLLESKTRGNLSEDEAGLIQNVLAEVRLRYVDAAK